MLQGMLGAASGAGGAATAAAGAAMPWSIILPTLASLVSGLFGGKSEEEKKQEDVAEMKQYLNQFYMPSKGQVSGMNNVLTRAIMNNLGRYSDWGWEGTSSDDLRGLIGSYLASPNVLRR